MLKVRAAAALSIWMSVVQAGTAPESMAAKADLPTGMAGALIGKYHMQRVPQEGVWFALTYLSSDVFNGDVLPARYAGRTHAAGSAIVLVATPRDFSALHRLQSDEVWHFYGGSPLELLLLYPDGTGKTVVLGADVLHDQVPQFTVPHGVWMGAAPRGRNQSYSFGGTQLALGFTEADFEMGYRDALTKRYPAFASQIARLTRTEYATAPNVAAAATIAGNAAKHAGRVFSTADVATLTPAAGVEFQELAGRLAKFATTEAVSIAKFTLRDGASSGRSLNRASEEALVVTGGSGSVTLKDHTYSLDDKSVVYIAPGEPHEIVADAYNILEFYAISAPAFSPDDYVSLSH